MKREAFYKRFDTTFKLKEKGFNESMQEFARTAFSNLVGGISYFYGSSLVQSKHNPVRMWIFVILIRFSSFFGIVMLNGFLKCFFIVVFGTSPHKVLSCFTDSCALLESTSVHSGTI